MTTTPDRRTPDRGTSDRRTPDRRTPDRRTPDRRTSDRGTCDDAAPDDDPPDVRAADPRTADVPDLPGLPGLPGARGGEPRPARDLPRWVRWTVLPLMVIVPAVYVAISAEQSRDSGQSKEEEAAARRLTAGAPSSLQQRIYQVAFPAGATGTGYLETNSWDTSVLYAQFTTTAGGLDAFLAGAGTSRPALHEGRASITAAQARAAGWDLGARGGPWEGIALQRPGDKPDHAIAVDLGHPDAPTVYVVSTVNFQHGFRGGG